MDKYLFILYLGMHDNALLLLGQQKCDLAVNRLFYSSIDAIDWHMLTCVLV